MEDKGKTLTLARRLTLIRAGMVDRYPFFGRLLLHLTLGLAPCGTAFTDMHRVVFDPSFADSLSDGELRFVFLHEIMHCVLDHCVRGHSLDHEIYNTACDIVVNSFILEAMGIDDYTVDASPVMHLAPDGLEGRVYTAEEVYRMLAAGKDEDDAGMAPLSGMEGTYIPGEAGDGRKGNDSGGGNTRGVRGGSSSTRGDPGDEADKDGPDKDGSGSTDRDPPPDYAIIDTHEPWDGVTEEDSDAPLWQQRILEASRSCGSGSGIPAGIRRHIAQLERSPRTNWKQLLHDYIQNKKCDYTFSSPDRRYSGDIIMPSFIETDEGMIEKLWLLIDTSGSISDSALTAALQEIVLAMEQTGGMTGRLSFFDDQVSTPEPFETAEDIMSKRPVGGGGTSFYAIFDYLAIDPADEPPSLILILTDGYADFPPEKAAMGIPVFWGIINSFEQPPWGESAHIDI